ncbi:DUF1688 family protein [Acuticoccus sp.]|uniref:DUF1688 family protein n=1 Tax=Acuticoccus sp. TaxID=1904378 RepID=UPI003B52B599
MTSEAALEDEAAAARELLTAAAVRTRSAAVFARIADGASEHFTYAPQALAGIADRVASLTRERHFDLAVPLHSRFRHFEAGGIDRVGSLAAARGWTTPEAAARGLADLAVVSVLLDAGAGPRWRYTEAATGTEAVRSEGLALASLSMFAGGAFSAVPADPLRVDAAALATLGADELAAGFQVSADNPLEGVEGRLGLLAALADAVRSAPDLFTQEDDPRPGGIIDALAADAENGTVQAEAILEAVLEGLGPIWPSRLTLAGVPLGDAWPYPPIGDGRAPGSDVVPFHKLSLWLSLSLVEPLGVRGIAVAGLDALPGLAEYRNGGLFVDGGALVQRHEAPPLDVGHPMIVEWRAATVTLLDRLAPLVREGLGVSADDLPLAAILEGGTWAAGRRLAAERRADASPPIAIVSDGTVF